MLSEFTLLLIQERFAAMNKKATGKRYLPSGPIFTGIK